MYRDSTLRCVLDSLSMFGENTQASLMSRLAREGISFSPDRFDIEKFCLVVETLLGHSADFIFVKIIDDVCRESKTSLKELGLDGSSRYQSLQELVKRVLTIVEVA